jgi:chromate reductase, NAD(P)H dehydrogenase (quinone)
MFGSIHNYFLDIFKNIKAVISSGMIATIVTEQTLQLDEPIFAIGGLHLLCLLPKQTCYLMALLQKPPTSELKIWPMKSANSFVLSGSVSTVSAPEIGNTCLAYPISEQVTDVRYQSSQPSEDIVMTQYRIAVIVGSLRRDSFNRKLANAIVKLAPKEFSFTQSEIGDLPLYNQDDDANPADSVKRLKREIVAAHGLLFVTAEYNRSIPGVLKNAIDHASRPYGKSVWAGKPAGILGASVGAIGTSMAQQHLRNILAYLDIPTMGQPEAFIHAKAGLFDSAGNIGEDSKKFLQDWMSNYVAWVKNMSID